MFKTTYHPESIVIFYLHMRTAMMTTTMTINMEIVVLSTTFFYFAVTKDRYIVSF